MTFEVVETLIALRKTRAHALEDFQFRVAFATPSVVGVSCPSFQTVVEQFGLVLPVRPGP